LFSILWQTHTHRLTKKLTRAIFSFVKVAFKVTAKFQNSSVADLCDPDKETTRATMFNNAAGRVASFFSLPSNKVKVAATCTEATQRRRSLQVSAN
jgi:hypothetical protein